MSDGTTLPAGETRSRLLHRLTAQALGVARPVRPLARLPFFAAPALRAEQIERTMPAAGSPPAVAPRGWRDQKQTPGPAMETRPPAPDGGRDAHQWRQNGTGPKPMVAGDLVRQAPQLVGDEAPRVDPPGPAPTSLNTAPRPASPLGRDGATHLAPSVAATVDGHPGPHAVLPSAAAPEAPGRRAPRAGPGIPPVAALPSDLGTTAPHVLEALLSPQRPEASASPAKGAKYPTVMSGDRQRLGSNGVEEITEVHVSIGRIEVSVPVQPDPHPARPPARPPTMSLDDYLARKQVRRA